MSKGEIIQHIGEGRYRVRQKLAVERIQRELDAVSARLAELAIQLPEAKLAKLQKEQQMERLRVIIDEWIDAYRQDPGEYREGLAGNQKVLARLSGEFRQIDLHVSELIAEDLANRKRQNQLQQIPDGRDIDAWCADYTDDLTGDVGLVDINDEGGKGTIIQPGFDGSGAYYSARDGSLFPGLAQSANQIFYNAALLPGVQRWRPRYRVGQIVRVDGDICDLLLDPAKSSAQGLDINQGQSHHGVPIMYMDCNGAVFEEGDRVLARHTLHGLVVIGFESNPRACAFTNIICTPMLSTGFLSASYWGPEFEDQFGAPINLPLGEPNNTLSAWAISLTKTPPYYSYTRGHSQLTYGQRNWISKTGSDLLSWHGPASRICALHRERLDLYDFTLRFPFHRQVYYKSEMICDLSIVGAAGSLDTVDGAAIVYKGEQRARHLRVCASNTRTAAGAAFGSPDRPWRCVILDIPWPSREPELSAAQVIGRYDHLSMYLPVQGFYFSASGGAAVISFADTLYDIEVVRWREGEGFASEIIFQPDSDTGGGSHTHAFTQASNVTWATDRQGFRGDRARALGYDFDGDAEKPVKLVLGPVTESIVHFDEAFMEPAEPFYPENPRYRESHRVETTAASGSSGAERILFGDRLLYENDEASQYSQSKSFNVTYEAYIDEDGHGREGRSLSGAAQRDEIRSRALLGGMFIDPRYGIIALEHRKETETVSQVASGFSGTIKDTLVRVASFRLYRDGEKLHQIETTRTFLRDSTPDYRLDAYTRYTSYIRRDPPLVDETVERWLPTFMSPRDSLLLMPCINASDANTPWGPRVRQGSFAVSSGRLMAGFEWLREDDSQPVRFTYVQGVSSPVQTIVGRSPDEGFMLGNISLV